MTKENPILFSGPMVRAILEGRKSMTRRVMKPQPAPEFLARGVVGVVPQWPHQDGVRWFMEDGMSELIPAPIRPGDVLWVREQLRRPKGEPWLYAADDMPVMVDKADETAMVVWAHHKEQDYYPSIFMPRWASRITLEVTGVKVERVQEISEEDAKAEGAMFHDGRPIGHHGYRHDYHDVFATARDSFAHLWQEINSKRPGCAWADNPWVWAYSFRRVTP